MKSIEIITFELSRLLKLGMLWIIFWIGMALLLFAFYDSIVANKEGIDALLASLPEELLNAFGSSADDFLEISGYFNSQFMSVYFIAVGILAAYIGVKSVGGEIYNKSILFLLHKPISRVHILLAKYTSIIIFFGIISSLILFASTLAAALLTSYNPLPLNYFALCGVIMFLYSLLFGNIGLLLGIIFEQSTALAIAIIYCISSFFINSLDGIEGFAQWINGLTVYSLIDLNAVAQTEQWDIKNGIIFLLLIIIITLISIYVFRRKDINV